MRCSWKMLNALLGLVMSLAMLVGATNAAHSQSDAAPQIETVLVVGEQPGPGLWKVTKDGNVLWIVSTFGPLSARVIWRSQQVEAILKGARELYTEPNFEAYLPNDREGMRLMDKATQNDTRRTLQDVVPADLYGRFDALQQEYAGGRRFEELRPFIAVQRLKERAMRTLSLTGDGGIRTKIVGLAKRNRVKVRSLTLIDNSAARPAMLDLDAIPREADIPCMRAQLARLETELNEAALRANAWASGDVAELRRLIAPAHDASFEACKDLLLSSKYFRNGILEAYGRAETALRGALTRNGSTVALMPIEELFRPNGLLAGFRRDGYQVEEPDQPL
jgi:uncharacterized protein YbaP (TraB family)